METNPHPLKAYRKRHNPPLTQDDLAGLLGVSKGEISRWEKGLRRPGKDTLPTITARTGITAKELRPDLWWLMQEPRAAGRKR